MLGENLVGAPRATGVIVFGEPVGHAAEIAQIQARPARAVVWFAAPLLRTALRAPLLATLANAVKLPDTRR